MCVYVHVPPHVGTDVDLNNLRGTGGLTGAHSTLDPIAPDLHRKPAPAGARGAASLCRSGTDGFQSRMCTCETVCNSQIIEVNIGICTHLKRIPVGV